MLGYMKRKTRIISLILALCLLSACGKTEQRRPGRYVLVPERTEFGDVELTGNAVMLGGEIYFLGSEGGSGVGIYAVPASGGSPRRLEGYAPAALPAGSRLELVCWDPVQNRKVQLPAE